MCHPRHLKYLLFSSLGVMPRVSTVLHLSVAHNDDIIRHLVNCDENYKFVVYSDSILQEFIVNKVIVISYPETMRKLHAWRTGFNRVLKRSASITYSWVSYEILVLVQLSSEMICLDMLHLSCSSYHRLQLVCHESQFHLHHFGSAMTFKADSPITILT